MMLFKLQKNNNPEMKEAYGNYYALPVILQTMGIAELAVMMAEHNTGFSAGQVKGMLTDMVICIRELCLQGIAVKIDNLAIFSIGIKHKEGANSEKEFTVAKNVEGVRLRARATGELVSDKLKLDATLKKASSITSGDGGDGSGDDSPTTPSGDGDNKGDAGSTTPTTPSGGGSGSTPSQGGGGTSDGGGGSQEGGGSSSGSENPKEFD